MTDYNPNLKINALCRARTNEEVAAVVKHENNDKGTLTPVLAAAGVAQSILTNDVATLRKFFEKGADPNDRTSSDHEPLFFHAVTTGNIEMANAFLDAGADLTQMDSTGGFSAMHAAVMSRDKGMIIYMMAKLVEAGFDYHGLMQEALFTAIFNDDPEQVAILLESGADPDGDTWHGHRFYPPLLEAVRQHNKPIAELLMEFGAIKGKECVELKCLLAGQDY